VSQRRKFIGPRLRSEGGIGRQYDVWPLDNFDVWKQYEIACDVAEPKPPAKWIRLVGAEIRSRAWYEWHWQRGVDPDSKRPWIDSTLRQGIYQRDGHRCLHCGSVDDLTLDHIHPYSMGGADALDNLQTLCRSCNSKKGARV
jgi:hypothetical protein